MKTILFVAGLGILLLLVAIIILVSLNWSVFYAQLATLMGAFVGTVVALIVVLATLKGDTFSDEFTTFVVVNTETHLPVFPNQINPDRNSLVYRLGHYSGLASPKLTDQTGKEIILFAGPQNVRDETPFYEELLQYEVVMEVIDMHNPNPWIRLTVGEPGPSVGANKPFKLSDADKKPLLDTCPDISKLRFSNNPVERQRLKVYSSRLPKNTTITLQPITSTERAGSEKHTVVLTKPYFFTIEITIEPAHFSGQTGIPANSGISPELATKSKTLMFQITMVARFERLTSGNRLTPELKDWTKWMFGRLQTKFSDTTPN